MITDIDTLKRAAKAGMEEAEALARSMFNGAANGDEIADAIYAAMEAVR